MATYQPSPSVFPYLSSLRRRCLPHPTTCSPSSLSLPSFCVLSDFQCSYMVGLKESVSISISHTIQLGMLGLTYFWRGLDLIAFNWVLTQLSGITTPSIGLQSGVIYVGFSSILASDYEFIYYIIAARFNIGVSIAIPATVLSINRRLYLLASPTSVLPSQADKRREIIIDFVIGIGLPVIVMILCVCCYNLYTSLAHPHYSVFRSRVSIYYCRRLRV